MASVTLKGITKRWNEFLAVRNLSLAIEDQEFLVLHGTRGGSALAAAAVNALALAATL